MLALHNIHQISSCFLQYENTFSYCVCYMVGLVIVRWAVVEFLVVKQIIHQIELENFLIENWLLLKIYVYCYRFSLTFKYKKILTDNTSRQFLRRTKQELYKWFFERYNTTTFLSSEKCLVTYAKHTTKQSFCYR